MAEDGEAFLLDGTDLFSVIWLSQRESITVAHPQHPELRHSLSVWSADEVAGQGRFAAGELSAGVWAFFVPE